MALVVFVFRVSVRGRPRGSATLAGKQAFALKTLARELACTANGFGLLTCAFLGRLFVMIAKFHFTEDAFALHLFLERFERLVNIVVANKYLHELNPVTANSNLIWMKAR